MNRALLFIPFLIFLVLGFFLWRGLYLDPKDVPSALVGKSFPAFDLPDLMSEQRYQQNLLTGKVQLVNIWGTWCVSCKIEHPYLVQKAAEGVSIIGISYKDDNEAARRWLNDLGNPYAAIVVDEEGLLGLDLGVTGAPETFIVDAKGIIRYKHTGVITAANWSLIAEQIKLAEQAQ